MSLFSLCCGLKQIEYTIKSWPRKTERCSFGEVQVYCAQFIWEILEQPVEPNLKLHTLPSLWSFTKKKDYLSSFSWTIKWFPHSAFDIHHTTLGHILMIAEVFNLSHTYCIFFSFTLDVFRTWSTLDISHTFIWTLPDVFLIKWQLASKISPNNMNDSLFG